jgi:hypothetical protein
MVYKLIDVVALPPPTPSRGGQSYVSQNSSDISAPYPLQRETKLKIVHFRKGTKTQNCPTLEEDRQNSKIVPLWRGQGEVYNL